MCYFQLYANPAHDDEAVMNGAPGSPDPGFRADLGRDCRMDIRRKGVRRHFGSAAVARAI